MKSSLLHSRHDEGPEQAPRDHSLERLSNARHAHWPRTRTKCATCANGLLESDGQLDHEDKDQRLHKEGQGVDVRRRPQHEADAARRNKLHAMKDDGHKCY